MPAFASTAALRVDAVLPALLVLAAVALPGAAQAGPLPNGQRVVSLTAREQPIGAFLQDLLARAGVPAVIAPNLAGAVNGKFQMPAAQVLGEMARLYNLVPYYDGAVMHVVPAADMTQRSYQLPLAASDRVLREAQERGLPDLRNTLLRSSEGSLVAAGTRRFVEQVDELVQAARASTPAAVAAPGDGRSADFRVFYLRYAWAQDTTLQIANRQVVVPGVASILRSLVGTQPAAPLGQETRLRPTQPSLKGQGLIGQGVPPAPASGSSATSGAPGKSGPGLGREPGTDALVQALAHTVRAAAPSAPAAEAAAETLAADGPPPRIEADPRLNAVLVRDRADRLSRYEQLIADLDVEPQSIEIEATIIDIATDRLRELGVNWRASSSNGRLGFQVGNGAQGPVPSAGGVVSAVLGSVGQFVARINALQAEGAAQVVSSPQVVTLSNVEAVFDNSSTFFVRVAGREQVDLFNQSVGTSLRVMPHVFRDHEGTRIRLAIHVEDGSITGQQVDQIPVVQRSTLNTQALIVEGESLLIGGMTREAQSQSVDKVPGLGDIPVLGHAFKNRSNSHSRVERMFLITPRLAGGGRQASRDAAREATPTTGRRGTAAAPARVEPLPAAALAAAPVSAPVSAPVLASAPVPAAAPVVPPRRSSVVIDLDAPPAAVPRAGAVAAR